MRPGVKAAGLLVIGLAVLAALVAFIGPSEVVDVALLASPLWLGGAIAAYALFFVLRGLRWRVLLASSAPGVTLASTTSVSAVGWLANSVLPFKGGDVLRAALLARRERLALAHSASTVALERVLDLVGLALLAAIGLALVPHTATLPQGIERALALVWVLPLAAVGTLFVLVRCRATTVRVARACLRPLGRVGARLADFGDQVLAGLAALAARPRLLARSLPLTLLVSTTQALVFAFLVVAFIQGTPLVLAFAGATLFLLTFVVSVTPGNVGTYEAGFVAVFVALGAPPETAIPSAILTHVVTTLTVAVFGGAALLVLGLHRQDSGWRPERAIQGGRG